MPMSYAKLRRQLAEQAARLMFENQISFQKATQQAVQRVAGGFVVRKALPTQREIRAEIARLAWISGRSDDRLLEPPEPDDPTVVFGALLAPLEQVKRRGRGGVFEDYLSHSLRVFDLACDELPYDEEFLTAALLHEVGQGIDPQEPVAAGLDALGELITPRAHWLIENLAAAHASVEGNLGHRSQRRLAESEWFEDLLQLADCDRRGISLGERTSDLETALEYLRRMNADDDAPYESGS